MHLLPHVNTKLNCVRVSWLIILVGAVMLACTKTTDVNLALGAVIVAGAGLAGLFAFRRVDGLAGWLASAGRRDSLRPTQRTRLLA